MSIGHLTASDQALFHKYTGGKFNAYNYNIINQLVKLFKVFEQLGLPDHREWQREDAVAWTGFTSTKIGKNGNKLHFTWGVLAGGDRISGHNGDIILLSLRQRRPTRTPTGIYVIHLACNQSGYWSSRHQEDEVPSGFRNLWLRHLDKLAQPGFWIFPRKEIIAFLNHFLGARG